MIALDTNVLLRYLVQDGGNQAVIATRLIENDLSAENPGFVSLPVMCELVWALSQTYAQPRAAVVEAVLALLEASQIEVESRQIVRDAAEQKRADIADGLIHFVGQNHGCSKTVTFDRKFARLARVEMLTS